MSEPIAQERVEWLRENHAPWHYTEFGVLCSCGEAVDANEECPTLQLVSEIERQRDEIDDLTAQINEHHCGESDNHHFRRRGNPASDAMTRLEAMGNG